jgi:hypothetical protein
MKVLSFSLWGDKPIYTIGAVKNAILAKSFYPDFQCWFYIHNETVPKNIIDDIDELPNTRIIFKTGDLLKVKPMCWRFEAIDDPNCELMMPRDTDTRIFLREKLAVDEWLNSDKLMHIMRDHKNYHRNKIFGGMFGIKKIPSITWRKFIDDVNQNNDTRNYDLAVLNNVIQNIRNNDILVHSPYHLIPGENRKDFPISYEDDNYNFVGCYIYEDDTRNEYHHEQLK